MIHRWIGPLVAGAAWLGASAAMATQEPPRVVLKPVEPEPAAAPASSTVAPVIVEATKPAELRKQTYDFVQTYAATTDKLDQLARWNGWVCVSVQGLPADAAAQVKTRVEEVAKALKVAVDKPGCGPNIQIFYTNQPQPLLDKVAAEHEHLLGYRHRTNRVKLKTVTRPIQAWYVTATGGSGGNTTGMTFENVISSGVDGKTAPPPVPTGAAGRQPSGEMYDDEDNDRSPTGCGEKHAFTVCLASMIRHVLVVVDTSRVQDQNPGVIADYVTMLAMAQPRSLDGCNVLPSVIDLFAGACAGGPGKDGLTRADVAYLTALYKTDLEAKKAGQQTDIADKMADMLLKASATDRVAAWGGRAKTSKGR